MQSSTPLVKLKTLDLIVVALNRATDTSAALRSSDAHSSPSPFATYTDLVLKQLPELKTLVNLWQQLHRQLEAPGGRREPSSSLEQAKTSSDSLSPEHRVANAGLLCCKC